MNPWLHSVPFCHKRVREKGRGRETEAGRDKERKGRRKGGGRREEGKERHRDRECFLAVGLEGQEGMDGGGARGEVSQDTDQDRGGRPRIAVREGWNKVTGRLETRWA